MSNQINEPVKPGKKPFNIITFNGQLLEVKSDGTISLNAKLELAGDDSVQFCLDTSKLVNSTQLVFFIRPKNTSTTKYLAVSGTKLVLKGANEVSDNSHRFLVIEQNDSYLKLRTNDSSSTAPMFITDNKNGGVVIEGDSPTDTLKAWLCFKDAPITNTVANVSNAPIVFSAFEIEKIETEE